MVSYQNQESEGSQVVSGAMGKETSSVEPKKSNPFDLKRLRISQDFALGAAGVKKVVTTIPVRKPDRQAFFRVRPGSEYRLETAVIELKEENETYLVAPDLWAELSDEIVFKTLYTAIDRQGNLFLIPIRMRDREGKLDNWNRSALVVIERSEHRWVRMCSSRQLGAYEAFEASAHLEGPVWPELSLQEIVEIAFRDRLIDSLEHPIVKRLRGDLQ